MSNWNEARERATHYNYRVVVPDKHPPAVRMPTPNPKHASYPKIEYVSNEDPINTLLSDEEFDSIYTRMTLRGQKVIIDEGSKREVVITDDNHPFVQHVVRHYSHLFKVNDPSLSRDRFFRMLKVRLDREKSSQEVLDECVINSSLLRSTLLVLGRWLRWLIECLVI